MEILAKSYEVVFIIFVSVSVLTGLQSLTVRNNLDKVKLQLSTVVTCIAAFHYHLMINRPDNLVLYRYLDWYFTTPLLLIDFALSLGIKDTSVITKIIGYNTAMLTSGVLGEMNVMTKYNSCFIGFIPLYLLFNILYQEMEKTKENIRLFKAFVGVWVTYGLVYLLENEDTRNLSYNILDIISKGFFGMYIYYTSI
jgi:bacteriorhodopsin